MEIIKYLRTYALKENAIKIDIKDVKEGDFIHITGYYNYEDQDQYGRSFGWEYKNYNEVKKITFSEKDDRFDSEWEQKKHYFNIESKKKLIKEFSLPEIRNSMFENKKIEYFFYRKESIKETITPNTFVYKCDCCNESTYDTYKTRLTKNHKSISMKVMKDGTHKCYKCLGIGRRLPVISFDLKIKSFEQRDKIFRILRANSWSVVKKDEHIVIGMIMNDKIKYTKDMIDSLCKKTGYGLKLKKKEKFYNPEKSESIFYYE